MKVESISIQNFKLFDNLEVSFKHKTLEEVSNRFLVLGDNGTGKTTLLQAIALPLAIATKQIKSVAEFDWPEFLPERFWKWGTPRIQLTVSFVDEEIEATQEIAKQWYDAQPSEFKSEHPFIEPSNEHTIQLSLAGEYFQCGKNSPAERFQFQGRYYANKLHWLDSSLQLPLSKLPGIFWFDQYRNLVSAKEKSGDKTKAGQGQSFSKQGIENLRESLLEWKQKQDSGCSESTDTLRAIENPFQRIFPGRTFNGLEIMSSAKFRIEKKFLFLLDDGYHTYDIVEMSGGEQSIFPILYDFARQNIAHAIVLLDELDLNLHPPASQFVVNQLFKISSTCQFILTTHSEAVNNIVSENETWRLEGGLLCL